ncbi:hypothetical protein BDZ91DRAFT_852060 [Kalaharituber pfeilii]|nr:hypothetical protein BDZ91DRAFT_852060 [Kalaharituber pfeilii]
MNILPPFDPLFFESPLVKITLAEDHDSDAAPDSQANTTEQSHSNQTTQNSTFYIHKDLLTSISPELRKHIDNEMKEGLRGEITLAEVERQTMQHFLLWAYRGDYTISQTERNPTKQVHSPAMLLQHTKLYVFGDRFHVVALQDLSLGRVESLLPHLKLQDDYQEDALILLKALGYAADNLPSVNDRLIVCLLRLVTLRLKLLAVLPEFADLVHAQPEVAVSVCRLATGSEAFLSSATEPQFDPRKPWLKKGAIGCNEGPRKNKCVSKNTCNFVGFPNVKCQQPGCGFISGDARPGYPKSQWALFNCPKCGAPENLRDCCPNCEGTSFTWCVDS